MNIQKNMLMYIFIFIFLINSVNAISISLSIPEKYQNINPGERIYFDLDIKYPENFERKDLILEYEIINQDDQIIVFTKSLKAIETQSSFIESIIIPDSASHGIHYLKIKVMDYEDLNEEVVSTFYINKVGFSEIQLYFMIIILVVIILTILVLISIFKINKIKGDLL